VGTLKYIYKNSSTQDTILVGRREGEEERAIYMGRCIAEARDPDT
jgi:hypothetical protein